MGTIHRTSEKVLFYALSHPNKEEEGGRVNNEEEQKALYQEKGKMFHPEVQRLLKMTSDVIMFRELQAVKPVRYNPLKPTSRVTLLGDAAHAMTTHRGLGANIALQDAMDLAYALKYGRTLEKYEEILIRRGFAAIRSSRSSTNTIHASSTFMSYVVWVMFYVMGKIMWIYKKFRR